MIEIPEGVHVVMWCSLYCTGNESTGTLTIDTLNGPMGIPICDECKNTIESRLDRPLEGVVE